MKIPQESPIMPSLSYKPLKNTAKMAEKDADQWLRAEMFYGEGAGIRRRHLEAEIGQKSLDIPGYYDLFAKAYDALDKNKYAKAAIKERKNIDRIATAGKNFRALKNGNVSGLSTGVFIVVGTVWVAHQTGYDKKIEAEARKLYRHAKARYAARSIRKEWDNEKKEPND